MTWLIDTNVISEVRKRGRCHPNVARWWNGVRREDLFLSVVTLGEIRRGIESIRPRDPVQAATLELWLRGLSEVFARRILRIDVQVADTWGRLTAVRSVPTIDAQLAATAIVHGLIFVTRNTVDVAGLGVAVLDPFAAIG